MITRSTGIPLTAGSVTVALAGGGWQGITAELDGIVAHAAEVLAAAYGLDVEVRFNSDRESGGAFLVTPDRRNGDVGIGASLVTADCRRVGRSAEVCEREADAGRVSWQAEPLSAVQVAASRELAASDRDWLARHPEGELTVCAHLRARAVLPRLLGELAELPGWNPMEHCPGRAYHHGPAGGVAAALQRCLRFATPYVAPAADPGVLHRRAPGSPDRTRCGQVMPLDGMWGPADPAEARGGCAGCLSPAAPPPRP